MTTNTTVLTGAAIKYAANLNTLCAALNDAQATAREQGFGLDEALAGTDVDLALLPIFGGLAISNTDDIWSWDATHLITTDEHGKFVVRRRTAREGYRAAYYVAGGGQSDVVLTTPEQSDLPDANLIALAQAEFAEQGSDLAGGQIVVGYWQGR
jgi:hypothetical protein